MTAPPTVSVVMPVYNRERFVARAVSSILNQRFADFELIVVDDGSTDGTLGTLATFSDPRLRIVPLPANGGSAMARNVGIDLARGEFIATMDSDDVSLPDRLGRQVDFMRRQLRIDILGTNIIKVQRNGTVRQKHSPKDGVIKARLLALDGSAMIHPSTMVRRSFLDRHDLRYLAVKTDEDHAFWIEAMVRGARFSVLQEYLVEYYRHDSNMVVKDTAGFIPHEQRKTPMRARLLALFYPQLGEAEALAIARWMEVGRRNSRSDVLEAVAAIRKSLGDNTSRLGEAKSETRRILEGHLASALDTLERRGRAG
jgi:glycosyltransferase involved in cell wall biosynthesis